MSKFEPKVISGTKLADMACDQFCDAGQFDFILDSDGEVLEGLLSEWFVIQWPDHCTTEQHLGDAYVYGPYGSEQEAEESAN